MVRQKEIAEKLNLSIMTVSKALRNHSDLSETTRKLVIQKALEMGYTKIPAITSAPKRLGVLQYASPYSEDPNSYNAAENAAPVIKSIIHRRIFEAIQKECRRNSVEVVVELLHPNDEPLSIKNRTVSAVLLMGRYTNETISLLGDMPALAVSSFINGNKLSRITADNIGGTKLMTDHMISLGHKKILYVGFIEKMHTEIYRERSKGYVIATVEAGLTPEVIYVEEAKLEAVVEKLSQYTAVVCAADGVAYALIRFLEQAGRRVPDDISIVGFDNFPSENAFLTTYSPNWEQMGALSAFIAMNFPHYLINGGFNSTVPGQLILRNTTRSI